MGEQPTSTLVPRLEVLMFTDIVDSVAHLTRLGDWKWARQLSAHNQAFRETLGLFDRANELQFTGDGFLASFAAASDAVAAALIFLQRIADEPWPEEPIEVRIGLHLGENLTTHDRKRRNDRLVGLAVSMTQRIMDLAVSRQVLMSASVRAQAQRSLEASFRSALDAPVPEGCRFVSHGLYELKGFGEPVEVVEVGMAGVSPFIKPVATRKGTPAGSGWRPEAGATIPGRTEWRLVRRLGVGGFGEAWLVRQERTGHERCFKFGFSEAAIASLRRELKVSSFLRATMGQSADIATVVDFRLTESPYYLESEYSALGDLRSWAASRGGIAMVPLDERVKIAERLAHAVAHLHSIGVVHRDLKPDNVLMHPDSRGRPVPRLCDFGVGLVLDPERLKRALDTASPDAENTTGAAGWSVPYSAPEILRGEAGGRHSDVYSLGVILCQLAAGDLMLTPTEGWQERVRHPLLREDIRACLHFDPARRIQRASDLAERLGSLEARESGQRAARRVRAAAYTVAGLTVCIGVMAWAYLRESRLRDEAMSARDRAQTIASFLEDTLRQADPWQTVDPEQRVAALESAARRLERTGLGRTAEAALVHRVIGRSFAGLNQREKGLEYLEKALAVGLHALGGDHPDTGRTHLAFAEIMERAVPESASQEQAGPALRHVESAIEVLQRHPPENDELIGALAVRALILSKMERGEEGVRDLDRIIAILEQRGDEIEVAKRLVARGEALFRLNRLEEADASLIRALATLERLAPQDIHTNICLGDLGVVAGRLGRRQEAITYLERSVSWCCRWFGPRTPTAKVMNNLGRQYHDAGRLDLARDCFERAIEICLSVGEEGDAASHALNLGWLLLDAENPIEAATVLEEAIAKMRKRGGAGWLVAIGDHLLGAALIRAGDYGKGLGLLLSGYDRMAADEGTRPDRLAQSRIRVADAFQRLHEAFPLAGYDADAKAWHEPLAEPNR